MDTDDSKNTRQRYSNDRAMVNEILFAPYDGYGNHKPGFLIRGYYWDKPFTCRDCGVAEVWTARQQKWWYEQAKGGILTTAIRCRACRKKEQARRSQARRIHLDGIVTRNDGLRNPPR